jgi:hypothetical protein
MNVPVFVVNKDNILTVKEYLKSIYEMTLKIHNQEIVRLAGTVPNSSINTDTNPINTDTDTNSINNRLIDLCYFYEHLKSKEFRELYDNVCMRILEKTRSSTKGKHSDECVVRAVVDIFMKFFMDHEYIIKHKCCDCPKFVKLEFEILKDISWKILEVNRWGEWDNF